MVSTTEELSDSGSETVSAADISPTTPSEHLNSQRKWWENSAPTPANALSELQRHALSVLAEQPDASYWRTMQALEKWHKRKVTLAPRRDEWWYGLPESKKHVLGKLDPFLLDEMLVEAGHADTDFVEDLLKGFPLTGRVAIGGLGTDIPEGLRSRGRLGLAGLGSLQELQRNCAESNADTIARAWRRWPTAEDDVKLAEQVWLKTCRDIDAGRAGCPKDLGEVDLENICWSSVSAFGSNMVRRRPQKSEISTTSEEMV